MLPTSFRTISLLLLLAITQFSASQERRGVMELYAPGITKEIHPLAQFSSLEICDNGLDDDGDGLIDCDDNDCQILSNGGFEDVPINNYPGAYLTFPPYPAFTGSWAAVNIDGEVFVQSDGRPAHNGVQYASLLQNSGSNPRTAWSEVAWGGGGYDRFLFIGDTYSSTNYNLNFYHASDDRYNYFGDQTLIQVQSLQTSYYYDTLITTPGVFEWEAVTLQFTTDDQTSSVAILFSSYGNTNSSVLVDDLGFCGQQDLEVIANNDTSTTSLGNEVIIEVLANDQNVPMENVTLGLTATGSPTHGTVDIMEDGTISYQPNENVVAIDSFEYIVCNTTNNPSSCGIATVYVEITGAPPVALDDRDTTIVDQTLEISVLANDYDADNELNLNSLALVTGHEPASGIVTLNGDGSFTYEPQAGFEGVDSFQYVVCDVSLPQALRDTATAYVHILPEQIVYNTEIFQFSLYEDSSLVICNDSNFENEGQIEICSPPQNGNVILEDGCAVYYPNLNYFGADELCLIACVNGLCDTSYLLLDVLPVNDAPNAMDDIVETNEEQQVQLYPLLNDTDIDSELSLSGATILSAPAHGELQMDASGWWYQPEGEYIGMDTIRYLICDEGVPEHCDWASIIIEILPTTDTLSVQVYEDSSILICPNPIREGGRVLPSTLQIQVQHGTILREEQFCIDYQPDPDWHGWDTLQVTVCYQDGLCDTFLYVIEVLPVNDAPLLYSDTVITTMDQKVTVSVLSNDSDPKDQGSMDINSVYVHSAPLNGAAIALMDGTVEYVPAAGFTGRDSLVYEACDNGYPSPGICGTATLHITVAGVESSDCLIPESFSPNGDGLYDRFEIQCLENYPGLELFVYDRFGNQIYDSRGPYQNNWDGSHFKTGQHLNDGTYYWMVRFNNGLTRDRAGHVLIWR